MKREIRVLRAFKHPNIVKLLGYHVPEGARPDLSRMCLVYELASNGGLDDWLRDTDKAKRLDWRQRLSIALGIAMALNYLHCHTPGNSAYHRDVKSSNIGLTVDFVPKLLDCGLAKYIPSTEAAGQTVFSRTGMIFGTQGYMCSEYVNTGVYDAKSEVYAFGIVLAELYGGKLQNVDGVRIKEQALATDKICPDVRVVVTGEESRSTGLLQRWKELVGNCIKDYDQRYSEMMAVMRELRSMEEEHYGGGSSGGGGGGGDGATEELNVLRRELEDMRLREKLEQRSRREEQRQCLVCFDNECKLAKGVECSNRHYVCDGCFRADSLTQQLSADCCRLVCQWCEHVFEDSEVQSHLGREGFARLLRVREKATASAAPCIICGDPCTNPIEANAVANRCVCDSQVCMACLRRWACVQIREGERVTCPGFRAGSRVGVQQRCATPVSSSLLDVLFAASCPLCPPDEDDMPSHSQQQENPLVSCGCALESHHLFCTPCLSQSVAGSIQAKRLPRCPRAPECRYQLDEVAVRAAIGDGNESLVHEWHDLLVQSVQQHWEGNKPCPTPNCTGFLSGSFDVVQKARSGEASEVRCNQCLLTYCWTCASRFHHGRGCGAAIEATGKWLRFLRSVTENPQAAAAGGGAGGGAGSIASEGEWRRLAAAAAEGCRQLLLRMEAAKEDAKYFKENIERGNLKKCPQCRRLIEKMEGCDAMVRFPLASYTTIIVVSLSMLSLPIASGVWPQR